MSINSKTFTLLAIILLLLVGCGDQEPTATQVPPSATTQLPPKTATTASTWFKTYGGPQDDVGWEIVPADDGGYYIVGTTGLEFEPQARANVYLIRTDAAGEVLWERVYERDGYAEGAAISWAGDGNLLISGPATFSTTSDFLHLLKAGGFPRPGETPWYHGV